MYCSLIKKGNKNGEFETYFQPIIDSNTHKVVTCEALVRWKSLTQGLVGPSDFIPILEKNGFIGELDYYVREKVCEFIVKNKEKGLPFPISVNVSRIEFNSPDFVKKLIAQVDKFGLDHSLLRIEITESLFMDKYTQSIKNIRKLKKSGFYIEMDDFGSGYSSLSILRDLDFDLIKLDLRFFASKTSKKEEL
ncbi:MAG: EAL domain-containing protein [Ignavibacteriales bacterium]|nr:EAL domain-containing protein [Ignavibacteriales bacterium]